MLKQLIRDGYEDRKSIEKYRRNFLRFSNEILVEKFNEINGLYGVHEQGLWLMGMHQAFEERFGKSPFQLYGPNIIGRGPKIIYLPKVDSFVPVESS